MQKFVGRMRFNNLEGGFWELVTEEGGTFTLGKVAPEFAQENLRVEVVGELSSSFGIFMSGKKIKITSIRKI